MEGRACPGTVYDEGVLLAQIGLEAQLLIVQASGHGHRAHDRCEADERVCVACSMGVYDEVQVSEVRYSWRGGGQNHLERQNEAAKIYGGGPKR